MRFCNTEVMTSKNIYNPHIITRKLVFFVIEAIKSGAKNIEISAGSLRYSNCTDLTLTCDCVLKKDIVGSIGEYYSPSEATIDDGKSSKTYYYYSDKTNKTNFTCTEISENSTEGKVYTRFNTRLYARTRVKLTSEYLDKLHVDARILSIAMDFITVYLEFVPTKKPNITFNIYPEAHSKEPIIVPITHLDMLDTERHIHNYYENYSIDYFALPLRKKILYHRLERLRIKNENGAFFEMSAKHPYVLPWSIVSQHTYNKQWMKRGYSNCIIAIITERD